MVRYDDVADAVAATGMVARGAFVPTVDDGVPEMPMSRPARAVVMVGNTGGIDGPMWQRFTSERRDEPDPLDAWTRRVLRPIAEHFDGVLVHPSDRPYRPFQRWAQRAADVWPSPIGLLVDPVDGLWHALRGAILLAEEVVGAPPTGASVSPCLGCDAPCLTACPVGAFAPGSYDHEACRGHVRGGDEPVCRDRGCAARRACPVRPDGAYGRDQMRLHMSAFVGDD